MLKANPCAQSVPMGCTTDLSWPQGRLWGIRPTGSLPAPLRARCKESYKMQTALPQGKGSPFLDQ